MRSTGFVITEKGPDLWHVHFSDANIPGKAIDENVTSAQIIDLYKTLEKSYIQFEHRRRGRKNKDNVNRADGSPKHSAMGNVDARARRVPANDKAT